MFSEGLASAMKRDRLEVVNSHKTRLVHFGPDCAILRAHRHQSSLSLGDACEAGDAGFFL